MQLLLDQPDLLEPGRSRRLKFGPRDASERIAILNGRARTFEGGAATSDLTIKSMIRGSAEYEAGKRQFRLAGKTELLLNAGEPYRLRFRKESESFTVFFSSRLADAAWKAAVPSARKMPEFPTLAAASPASLQNHFAALREEACSAQPDGEDLTELAFALLSDIADLARLRRDFADRVPAVRKSTRFELLRRVSRAEDYLRSAGSRATLGQAATAAALSPFHLLRVFRAVHGETPLAYAAGKRLELARNALVLTNDSIEAIGRRAGYESRTAFDRAFRRRFGATPGQVRVWRL